MDLQERRGSR